MLLRMKIRIFPHTQTLVYFSPDSNWYISVVLLYVIAAVLVLGRINVFLIL